MEDAILILSMLFVLVMASFLLDTFRCSFLSQSGFALFLGIGCGCILATVQQDIAAPIDRFLEFDNNVFFYVLLPPIIYEAGFSMKTAPFFNNLGIILSTSIIGTMISTIVIGASLYIAGIYELVPALSWVETFLFGALISAIDPVATLACFNKLNAPAKLFNMAFGESVLNDAVSIVLYQTLLKWEPNKTLSFLEVLSVAGNTMVMLFGSLGISAVITLTGAFLMNKIRTRLRQYPVYEISLVFIFSLLTYFVADLTGLSGIVALFFSGTMTAHYHYYAMSKEGQHTLTHLLHTLAFVCENFVYVFMGVSIVLVFTGQQEVMDENIEFNDINWRFIGLTLAACLLGRACNIFPLALISNCFDHKISVKYMAVLWFSGLRGAIAFALAKTWSYEGSNPVENRRLIVSTTLAVVLFTTIIIGGLTGSLLQGLDLIQEKEEECNGDTVAAPKPQIRKVTLRERRLMHSASAHFVISTTASDEFASEHALGISITNDYDDTGEGGPRQLRRRTLSPKREGGRMNRSTAVMTPRPQFRLSIGLGKRRERNEGNKSFAANIASNWNYIDKRYLQKLFGGKEDDDNDNNNNQELSSTSSTTSRQLQDIQLVGDEINIA